MSQQDGLTTLVCLFHDQDRAHAAFRDLNQAGIAPDAISLIGGPGASVDTLEKSELASLGMPDKDYDHLKDGIHHGGIIIAVSAIMDKVHTVEAIFDKHSANKIDEVHNKDRNVVAEAAPLAAAAPIAAPAPARDQNLDAQTVIPIVEEQLVVGKRIVNQGGVRVFRHVVELPAEGSIGIREEHITLERRAVNRAATDADLAFGDRTIELTETTEEPIVSKDAHVVEEVLVGKTATEHIETIHDTVRRTEIEVEEIPPSANSVDTATRGK